MKTEDTKSNRPQKILLWIARIWSLILIVYAVIVLVGSIWNKITTGSADPNALEVYPFIENLPPVFMFIAICGLGAAWKWEKIGGVINLIFCIVTIPILIIQWPISQDSRYIIPYILVLLIAAPGVLFLVHEFRSKRD